MAAYSILCLSHNIQERDSLICPQPKRKWKFYTGKMYITARTSKKFSFKEIKAKPRTVPSDGISYTMSDSYTYITSDLELTGSKTFKLQPHHECDKGRRTWASVSLCEYCTTTSPKKNSRENSSIVVKADRHDLSQ